MCCIHMHSHEWVRPSFTSASTPPGHSKVQQPDGGEGWRACRRVEGLQKGGGGVERWRGWRGLRGWRRVEPWAVQGWGRVKRQENCGEVGEVGVEKGGEGGAYKIPGASNPLAYLNAGTCSILTHLTAHDLFTA